MGCSQSTGYKSFEAPASEPRRKQLRTTAEEEEEVIYRPPMAGENVYDAAQVPATSSSSTPSIIGALPGGQVQALSADIPKVDEASAAGFVRRVLYITEGCKDNVDVFYNMTENLGTGAHGSVWKAVGKSEGNRGRTVAVKVINKSLRENWEHDGSQSIRQEIAIMKLMDHPNIVKLLETFEDRRNVHLVMELCSGRSLADFLIEVSHVAESKAALLARQFLSGVSHIHGHRICHRDVKPDNLLFESKDAALAQNVLKLGDFGFSCRLHNDGTRLSTAVGTPYYVAPQVLQGCYDEMCDLWSCGVILYVMLCGFLPFYSDNDRDLERHVLRGQPSFTEGCWPNITSEARRTVEGLLRFNPVQRWTAEQTLRNDWVQQRVGSRIVEENTEQLQRVSISSAEYAPPADKCTWSWWPGSCAFVA